MRKTEMSVLRETDRLRFSESWLICIVMTEIRLVVGGVRIKCEKQECPF